MKEKIRHYKIHVRKDGKNIKTIDFDTKIPALYSKEEIQLFLDEHNISIPQKELKIIRETIFI